MIHDPSCSGDSVCGGTFVCARCGLRTGWCRGQDYGDHPASEWCCDCVHDVYTEKVEVFYLGATRKLEKAPWTIFTPLCGDSDFLAESRYGDGGAEACVHASTREELEQKMASQSEMRAVLRARTLGQPVLP